MKDLMRNYKMNIKRRMSVDSDSESTPLASSANSNSSFGAVQCMFPDSDWTDSEGAAKKGEQPKAVSPVTPKSFLRRPFCYPGGHFESATIMHCEDTYDKYPFYSKLQLSLSGNESSDKEIPTVSSVIEKPTTQTSLVTIFSIWNTMMGTSLLTISWGIQQAGLFPGLMALIVIGLVTLYTTYCVLQVNKHHGLGGQEDVAHLCKLLLGRWAEIIAKIFSMIVLIGANIVYWVLMSNFLYNFVVFIHDYWTGVYENATDSTIICPKDDFVALNLTLVQNVTVAAGGFAHFWNLYTTVPIFLALILFPLLNFKNVTFFTKFNSLGTLSVIYLMIFVSIKGYQWGLNVPEWREIFHIRPNFTALTGILAMSYFIHNIIIALVKSNKDQSKNGRDLSIAFILVTFTYVYIGTVFYITFPLKKTCIEDNLLNNFNQRDTLTIVARVLLLFQLITVFPLIEYMLRLEILQNVKMMLSTCNYSDAFKYWKVVLLNVIVVIICILFACFLPKIGTLIRYTGAMSGLIHIFTLPCLLKIASLRKQQKLTPLKCAMYIFIIVFGFVNLTSQFFIQD